MRASTLATSGMTHRRGRVIVPSDFPAVCDVFATARSTAACATSFSMRAWRGPKSRLLLSHSATPKWVCFAKMMAFVPFSFNAAIDSSHGHLKRTIADALLLRGTADCDDLAAYRDRQRLMSRWSNQAQTVMSFDAGRRTPSFP
jgi:hypothetical protein